MAPRRKVLATPPPPMGYWIFATGVSAYWYRMYHTPGSVRLFLHKAMLGEYAASHKPITAAVGANSAFQGSSHVRRPQNKLRDPSVCFRPGAEASGDRSVRGKALSAVAAFGYGEDEPRLIGTMHARWFHGIALRAIRTKAIVLQPTRVEVGRQKTGADVFGLEAREQMDSAYRRVVPQEPGCLLTDRMWQGGICAQLFKERPCLKEATGAFVWHGHSNLAEHLAQSQSVPSCLQATR